MINLEKGLKRMKIEMDMCCCSECETTFKVSDCELDHDHHDGWEMPPYTEILCPNCENGGCIDDTWYSDELLKKLEESENEN